LTLAVNGGVWNTAVGKCPIVVYWSWLVALAIHLVAEGPRP
jgi:hypothetical protein